MMEMILYKHLDISGKRSILQCSNDFIYLKSGDYNNEGIRNVTVNNGSSGKAHIFVNKSVTFDDYGSPRIVGYCTSTSLDSLYYLYIMLIDDSNVTVKDIQFDGFNFYHSLAYYGVYDWLLAHHGSIQISGNGSYAIIQNCEFQNMGRSYDPDSADDGQSNDAIIGSHPMNTGNTIYGVQILDNTFMYNPIDTSHGHEIYLTKNENAEISGNTIYNNGWGCSVAII